MCEREGGGWKGEDARKSLETVALTKRKEAELEVAEGWRCKPE